MWLMHLHAFLPEPESFILSNGIYYTNGATAGSVVITDGQGGNTLLTLNTPAAANADAVYVLIPDQGILAENGLYGTVTNTASITIFYG